MGELVRTGTENVPQMESFGEFEALTARILDVWSAFAVSREPSHEMLRQLDAIIALGNGTAYRDQHAADEAPLGIVAAYCGLLMKAYANSGLQDVTMFGRLMRDDVASIKPPVAAVEIACRRWRQKARFLPAISEILNEVRLAKSEIEKAAEFLDRLPALRAKMARDLGAG